MSRLGLFGVLTGAFCVLSACAEIAGFGLGADEVTRLSLYDGGVVASAPPGYCIATAASRPSAGMVVMGRCDDASSGGADGFVTLQVGAPATGLSRQDAVDLQDLLRSEAGRGVLSQTGNAAAIRVEDTELAGTTVTVRFQDLDPPPIAGLQSTEWRGFFDVGGRLATVAVRGLVAAPMGTDDGEVLLAQVIRSVRQANAAGATPSGS